MLESLVNGNRGEGNWSGQRGSNPRPSAWEADALPSELCPLAKRTIRKMPCLCQGFSLFAVSRLRVSIPEAYAKSASLVEIHRNL